MLNDLRQVTPFSGSELTHLSHALNPTLDRQRADAVHLDLALLYVYMLSAPGSIGSLMERHGPAVTPADRAPPVLQRVNN